MENIDVDKIANQSMESLSNMSAEEVKELLLKRQKESIESVKEELNRTQEIYKFLENKDFDFLEKTIVLSLVMIKHMIKENN